MYKTVIKLTSVGYFRKNLDLCFRDELGLRLVQ